MGDLAHSYFIIAHFLSSSYILRFYGFFSTPVWYFVATVNYYFFFYL